MRKTLIYILLISALYSCVDKAESLTFDDLTDKSLYSEGFTIHCRHFKEQKIKSVIVNNKRAENTDIYDFIESGYYHIEILTLNNPKKHIIRFVILDNERGEAEWGLKKFTPKEISYDVWDNSELRIIMPKKAPKDMSVPIILICGNETKRNSYNLPASFQDELFKIKRGIGSINRIISSNSNHKITVADSEYPISIDTFKIKLPELPDTIQHNTSIDADILICLEKDLYIPVGISLTINEGTLLSIDPGINIYNKGQIIFNGAKDNPITISCSNTDDFWGGFISTGNANSIEATYTIFCQSGYHDSKDFQYGHARRQALFFMENGLLKLEQCFMIDHIGQVLHPSNSTIEIKNSLIQRAITGGQVNYSNLKIDNTVFSDFPENFHDYQDKDNDCLYIKASDAIINNSVFMYAMDDGIDTGEKQGGSVQITNCLFESIYHEGAALSSRDEVVKSHTFKNCIFRNCGQGLEMGYSSKNHHAEVDSCIFSKNIVGIRWGDNYDYYQHEGTMHVSNSYSFDNEFYDIWNMNPETWEADTSKMTFTNVYINKAYPMHRDLIIYE